MIVFQSLLNILLQVLPNRTCQFVVIAGATVLISSYSFANHCISFGDQYMNSMVCGTQTWNKLQWIYVKIAYQPVVLLMATRVILINPNVLDLDRLLTITILSPGQLQSLWMCCFLHRCDTVETLYSTIYYSKYFIELNLDKSTQYVALWTHKRHPIPRPFRRAMECLLWVFQQKLTVL